MMSREDKERYIDVLLALGGHKNIDDDDEKKGVSDGSFGFHSPGAEPVQGTMQFYWE